jgi:hypothetical protein
MTWSEEAIVQDGHQIAEGPPGRQVGSLLTDRRPVPTADLGHPGLPSKRGSRSWANRSPSIWPTIACDEAINNVRYGLEAAHRTVGTSKPMASSKGADHITTAARSRSEG